MPLWLKDTANPLPKFLSASDLATYRVQDCFVGPGGFYHIPEKHNKIGTGGITSSTSSTSITGTNTLFLTEAKVGQWLVQNVDNSNNTKWRSKVLIGKIAAINSNTSITLAANALVTIGTASDYGIIQNHQPELLVAMSNTGSLYLADKMGAVEIVALEWGTKAKTMAAASTGTIYVKFSEPVKFTGAPTLTITNVVGAATYVEMDATGTRAEFSFTVPTAGTVISVPSAALGGTGNAVEIEGASPATTAVTSITVPSSVVSKFRSITSV